MRACGYVSVQSCMIARCSNSVRLRYDVATQEPTVDLILQEAVLSAVPRHRGYGAHAILP